MNILSDGAEGALVEFEAVPDPVVYAVCPDGMGEWAIWWLNPETDRDELHGTAPTLRKALKATRVLCASRFL